MEKYKKFFTSKLGKVVAMSVIFLFIGAIVAFSYVLNRQNNLSLQKPKASEIEESNNAVNLACDVSFKAMMPSSTPTPTLTPTITITPTPTITNTPSPTPTLNCKELDIAIVVDRSSTMTAYYEGRQKIVWAKDAVTTFVNKLKANSRSSSVNVAVASFGRRGNADDPVLGNLLYPSRNANDYNSTLHTGLSSDFDGVILPAVDSIRVTRPGTCVLCGLHIANNQLMTNSQNKKVVILLSDGLANSLWTGEFLTVPAQQGAISEANNGRSNNIEYRVLGYGKRDQAQPAIDETVLKKIACADPNDSVCVSNNYSYTPDPTDWSNGFLTILDGLCR